MLQDPVIQFNDVTFSYTSVPILENVNLSITQNELACIIGPNGGGKTTMLKLLLGRLTPDRGNIRILGDTPVNARPRIGYMPQHVSYDPQFPVTVRDVVLMGRLGQGGVSGFFGWNRKRDHEIAQKALADMDMDALSARAFSDLSGGQRQRVLIARALATEPDILLLDEPTANVDRRVEERFMEILKKLNKKMTILIVSHDIGFVSTIIETVICVNRKVVIHPTSDLTGDIIQDIYSSGMRLVRHNHRCSEGGHICD